MLKSLHKLLLFIVVIVFVSLCGCVNISYEGISENPLSSDVKVDVFYDKSQIKAPDYRVLGDASFEVGSKVQASEIQRRLQNFARKKGANAVLVVSIDRKRTGEARRDQIYNQNVLGWDVEDNSTTASQHVNNIIILPGMDEPENAIYTQLVKASLLFLEN